MKLTKTKSSCKTGWWLNIDGRPVAKFSNESDIDSIMKLDTEATVFTPPPCDYILGA